jgi:hypothetical protein
MIHKSPVRIGYPALFIFAILQSPSIHAQGRSHTDPAPIGAPVRSVVQIGPMNTSNYDVTITVLDTVRGPAALEKLKTGNAEVKPPRAGFDYLLARVRFALQGRAVSDIGVFELDTLPFQWVAYSAQFAQYEGASVKPSEPALHGPVRSGQTTDGWIVLAVEQSEREPLLVFDPSAGGATGRGNLLFFKLY